MPEICYNIIMAFGFFKKEGGKTHILAIDLGTASISAAMAVRQEGKKTEVLKVFRYPIDLFEYQIAGGAQLPHIFKEGFLRVFKDAHVISDHLDVVAVGLSDPFFLDKKKQRKVTRSNPAAAITAEEINSLVKTSESEIAAQNLAIVRRNILNTQVNGYDVRNASGYKGKTLAIEMMFTSISATLKEYIEGAKDKFFPKSAISYYSDAAIFREALRAAGNLSEPRIVIDIGGEVTGIFLVDDLMFQHYGAAAFGIRTLARRIASSLKIDAADTDSLLKKYTAGTLDDAAQAKISRIIASALADWWLSLKNTFKQFAETAAMKKVMLSGGGVDFPAFPTFLKENFKKDFNIEVDVLILRAEVFKDFFEIASQNLLSGGGDIVLASLVLLAPW
ncbi:hypothetical protein A3G55_03025 [Candidatus Giovannonibacteria bacterium RIFCSPLOWO2_12_FULL_44_25]|nr:MAG: hypothetical protein UW15_C0009G0023 [Parcubacteria group bacterium GW2011_GWC1_44_10]KKT59996.1 MAG: hypothetical protein UW53_C0004G0008 [Candidatus Giovannonibacteria bacterium GW2011_GWA1_44_25]KKU30114.1 MAG: hypothetical protein UX43_C0002G0008 [Candidatus Giovannonibacteria bacterium GW2011_GWB1_46_20]OGF61201.1 MAG: hypothetical protein A2656_04460 [Candidatus Giovannonibacteria bacterium RIFCSPHIGHO2_01_FULL_44_100]OGF87791.1 MAG: hypothetical protein A3I36_04155 [Candidatus Gi